MTDQELYLYLFIIDERTYTLLHRINKTKKSKRGDPVGAEVQQGPNRYLMTTFFVEGEQRTEYIHRIIYTMIKGDIPKDYVIDHVDGNTLNNKIDNLRLVTRSENTKNRRLPSNNKSGAIGVRLNNEGTYTVFISNEGVREYHGTYRTIEEAIALRKELELKYGYHPNHGSVRDTEYKADKIKPVKEKQVLNYRKKVTLPTVNWLKEPETV